VLAPILETTAAFLPGAYLSSAVLDRPLEAMCIAFYTLSTHPAYSLILATNRDEFLSRPALPAHWHGSDDTVICGIDVTGGGTWVGIERKTGKFGLLTNVREETISSQATSRGRLVTDWLESQSDVDVDAHLEKLQTSMMEYAGFNLLLGQINRDGRVEMGFLSNRSEHVGHAIDGGSVQTGQDCIRQLQDGSPYGVMSNGALACSTDSKATDGLNTAWPKMQTGSRAFERAVTDNIDSGDRQSLVQALMDVLK
jgi:uncharacterized protein with NRDE domain